MPIEFWCPGCQRLLRVPDGTEGQLAQCPLCGRQTPIPGRTVPQPQSATWESSPSRPIWEDARWSDQQALPSGPFGSGNFSTPVIETAEPSGSEASAQRALLLDWHRQEAYRRICTPANWLVALSAIAFGLGLVSLLLVVLGMAAEGQRAAPQPVDQLQAQRTAFFVPMGLGLLVDLVVLFGSMKMKQLESYGWAMTAALLAVVPCTSPCCVLTMPFGLWALVVLTDPAVKAAFK